MSSISNSRFVYDRFRQRALRRKAVAWLYVLAMLAYLPWRATVINTDALALSLVYFTAELLQFVLAFTLIFSSWAYRHRETSPAPRGLRVDVFVTTYREPIELVRWTLVAAKEIAYPHDTVLLDDGNREEMKALAEEIGVRYLARGNNLNAKAGNLNFGLAHSTAEFVMVFDADHVAMPHALDATLGFFRDARVAMVQTPQDYYNVDAFQFFNARRNGGLWHDQSFFYQIAQACRDSFNGASCVGTSVVCRRSAIDAIGGIPTDTVTEDVHTSLKLHKAGYEVVYLNESVAYGIAASDIRDYYKTRHRWAHGNIHVLRIENVPWCKELTLGQRLSYLTLGLIYLEGWQQLLLFIVPVASLLFGWAPFEITVLNVLIVLLFPILIMALVQELGCGLSRPWVNEIFSVARFPIHIVSWAALVRDKIPFRTSTKDVHGRIEWLLMTPQLAVLATSLTAFAFGVVSLALHFKVGPIGEAFVHIASGAPSLIDWNARLDQGYTLELVVVSGFWALFNAAKSGYLIRKAIVDAQRSTSDYRFHIHLPLEIERGPVSQLARVDRLSRSWLSASVYGGVAPAVGERLKGTLYLPSGPLAVDGVVQRRSPAREVIDDGADRRDLAGAYASQPSGWIECEFAWPDRELRDRLARSLYSIEWHREFMHRNACFSTPLEVLCRLLSLRRPFETGRLTWSPALYTESGLGDPSVAIVGFDRDDPSVSVLAFRPIRSGCAIELDVLATNGIETRFVRILGREPLHCLGSRGLDGIEVLKYRGVIETTSAESDLPVAAAAE